MISHILVLNRFAAKTTQVILFKIAILQF